MLLLCLLALRPATAQYGHVDHWETAIYASEIWKYHVGTTAPDSGWNGRFYGDTAWAAGKGGLGYGDGDDSTVVTTTPSLYLRKVFTITDTTKLRAALLSIDYDDAFVAYFNGFEIAREGIGKAWKEPKHTDTALYGREANLYRDGKYDHFVIHPNAVRNFLRQGDNVLALQIHNDSLHGDDLSAWVNLHFGIKDKSKLFDEAPGWLERPPVFSPTTTLPIVRLFYDTTITDTAKVQGHMEIVYHGKNSVHRFDENANNYNGRIAIKYRGNSTLQFPKKSFRIETQTPWGDNLNVSLLGMPAENDWVLYAPYIDKSLLRNELSYKIAYKTEAYGVVTHPCEVFINDYYVGVYFMMEKIKRDDNRLDIKKMTPADTVYPGYTGGYILKRDWLIGVPARKYFQIPRTKSYKNYYINHLIYDEPNPDSLHPIQRDYISGFMLEFEEMLLSDHYTDALIGYNKYIDIPSFADYMISREFGKEIDSYRYSAFMYKQHLRDGNRLHMGPTWDFNIGFGNVDFSTQGIEKPEGWLYTLGENRLFWFERLMEDTKFADIVRCRYNYHRANIMSDSSIHAIIDQAVSRLGDASYRNHYTWKTIGRYVWPNYFVGDTYQEEVDYLKNWVDQRLEWMDANLPGKCSQNIGIKEGHHIQTIFAELYPNPTSGQVYISANTPIARYSVHNMQGQKLIERNQILQRDFSVATDVLTKGTYLLKLADTKGSVLILKFIRN
jgi:hypothetical protein